MRTGLHSLEPGIVFMSCFRFDPSTPLLKDLMKGSGIMSS